MAKPTKETVRISLRAFVNFIAYISVICVGVALMLKNTAVGSSFTLIANVIAYSITAICGFLYAKSKRNMLFLVLWVIAVALIIISYVI